MSDPFAQGTEGDAARPRILGRGLLWFADVQDDVRGRLQRISPHSRKAFALVCAERVMRRHERQPPWYQRPFSLSWRPILDVMWEGLATESDDAARAVKVALEAFYGGPYNHDDGQEGPDDADDDAAAGAIYAGECFLSGDPERAFWASDRALDAVYQSVVLLLDSEAGHPLSPKGNSERFIDELSHPMEQAELGWQLSVLTMLEGSAIDQGLVDGLRRRVDE